MKPSYSAWMSWEGGVDLCGATKPGLPMPNVLVHVARIVHTPLGSAPSGMVLYQPDPGGQPLVVGFVCTDPKIGAYYGPKIFAGTPFENAPVLQARIAISGDGATWAAARVEVAGHVFETKLQGLGPCGLIHREPVAATPFWQQGLEAGAKSGSLIVDGKPVAITIPPVGIGGGPAALWSPCGIYAR